MDTSEVSILEESELEVSVVVSSPGIEKLVTKDGAASVFGKEVEDSLSSTESLSDSVDEVEDEASNVDSSMTCEDESEND